MGKPMVNCERVGLDFVETAPIAVTVTRVVPVPPERLWEILCDADSWTRWVAVITGVEWTSPFPIGVGSTRTVTMLGGLVGYEEYLAFEPRTRFAFRFNQTTRGGPDAFLEDYRLTDLGDGTTEVAWTMAMRIEGPSARFPRLIEAGMRKANARFLRKLASYAASNPTLAPQPGV